MTTLCDGLRMLRESEYHEAIVTFEKLRVESEKENGESTGKQYQYVKGRRRPKESLKRPLQKYMEKALDELERQPLRALQINDPTKFSRKLAKTQYRKLAKKYHPDKNTFGAPVFKVVKDAYDKVKDRKTPKKPNTGFFSTSPRGPQGTAEQKQSKTQSPPYRSFRKNRSDDTADILEHLWRYGKFPDTYKPKNAKEADAFASRMHAHAHRQFQKFFSEAKLREMRQKQWSPRDNYGRRQTKTSPREPPYNTSSPRESPRYLHVPPFVVQGLQMIERTRNAVTVKWTPSDANGGVTPVNCYEMQYREKAATNHVQDQRAWISASATLRECICRKRSLKPATEYDFRVRAKNRFGWGRWSNTITACTEADVPERNHITNLCSEGPSSIYIEWDVPVSNGSEIIDYELQWRPHPGGTSGTSSEWTSASKPIKGNKCRKRNLEPNCLYDFRVRARNAIGYSSFCAMTSCKTTPAAREREVVEMDDNVEVETTPAKSNSTKTTTNPTTLQPDHQFDGTNEENSEEYDEEDLTYGTQSDEQFWIPTTDTEGNTYYYRSDTGESTWDPPSWWIEYDNESGAKYYFNYETSESVWTLPEGEIPGQAEANINIFESIYTAEEQQMMNEMMPRSPVHASVTPKTKEETAY